MENATTPRAYAAKVLAVAEDRRKTIAEYKSKEKYCDWVEVSPELILLAKEVLRQSIRIAELEARAAELGVTVRGYDEEDDGRQAI